MNSEKLSQRLYQIFESVKQDNSAKFKQSVDVSFDLLLVGTNKQPYVVRDFLQTPHATREVRIAAFVEAEYHDQAVQLGAASVGGIELLNQIKSGRTKKTRFTHVVATQKYFKTLTGAARILGVRNLLPKSNVGTMVEDISHLEQAIKLCQKLVEYKADSSGSVKLSLGQVDTPVEQLMDNFTCLHKSICDSRPNDLKGVYWRQAVISTTMGPGHKINSDLLRLITK